jgi:hypothetical protein
LNVLNYSKPCDPTISSQYVRLQQQQQQQLSSVSRSSTAAPLAHQRFQPKKQRKIVPLTLPNYNSNNAQPSTGVAVVSSQPSPNDVETSRLSSGRQLLFAGDSINDAVRAINTSLEHRFEFDTAHSSVISHATIFFNEI